MIIALIVIFIYTIVCIYILYLLLWEIKKLTQHPTFTILLGIFDPVILYERPQINTSPDLTHAITIVITI